MTDDKGPGDGNYRVWWKLRKRTDDDPFDGTAVIVGHMEATRFLGIKQTELGFKYNVGMFRISDEWGASPASEES